MKLLPLLLLVLAPLALAAEPYRVGDKFVPFTTKDQHDRSFTYEGGARLVLVAFTMGAGKAANGYFEQQPATFLDEHHAVFISDIHGMPGIGRTFALPKMRKYPHRILLADADGFLDRYPREDDKLTALTLDGQGTITAISFVEKKQVASLFAAKQP